MMVVTHEMAFARDVSTNVVFMADGVICEEGKPADIFGNPQNAKTKDFSQDSLQNKKRSRSACSFCFIRIKANVKFFS